jgi:HAD superfamily hydrolase (TIGR01509 family)
MRYDGLLFDFDGVLADTEPVHWRCWREALQPVGFVLSWEDYCRVCRGVAARHMRATMTALWPGVAEFGELEERYHVAKERAFAVLAEQDCIAAETVSVLRELAGLRLGVVTTALRPIAEPVLRRAGILDLFHVHVYGRDVKNPKPAPDCYLLASERLGARRAVVFEDTAAGMESAKAAGLDAVYVEDCGRLPELVRQAVRET